MLREVPAFLRRRHRQVLQMIQIAFVYFDCISAVVSLCLKSMLMLKISQYLPSDSLNERIIQCKCQPRVKIQKNINQQMIMNPHICIDFPITHFPASLLGFFSFASDAAALSDTFCFFDDLASFFAPLPSSH